MRGHFNGFFQAYSGREEFEVELIWLPITRFTGQESLKSRFHLADRIIEAVLAWRTRRGKEAVMDGLASISGVGAVAGQLEFQAAYDGAVARKTVEVTSDIGESALKLIKAAVVSSPAPEGKTLDLRA